MRVAICALLTAFVLIPGAVLGLAVGGGVNQALPGNSTDPIKLGLTALLAFIGMFVGGAVWGWSISRVMKAAAGRRMAVAGGIGFALSTLVVVLTLGSSKISSSNSTVARSSRFTTCSRCSSYQRQPSSRAPPEPCSVSGCVIRHWPAGWPGCAP